MRNRYEISKGGDLFSLMLIVIMYSIVPDNYSLVRKNDCINRHIEFVGPDLTLTLNFYKFTMDIPFILLTTNH